MTAREGVSLQPIGDGDVARVAAFLGRSMRSGLASEAWARAMTVPWTTPQPNHGFLLEHEHQVVGANLAFYSERPFSSGTLRVCNLAALSVVPEHRAQTVRLLRGLLTQPGHVFTDLSPSGQVVGIDRRLGFRPLDTTSAITPNVPGRRPRGASLATGVEAVGALLADPAERRIFEDHRGAAAARHVLLVQGGRQCYVLYRRDRRKRLPVFATLLHVSDPDLYLRARTLVDAALLREGALATLVELRVLGGQVPHGARLYEGRPKMAKGRDLPLAEVDDLYSELTCVSW